MTYADIGFAGARREEERGSNAGARQVNVDLTHPVSVLPLWELSGSDRTPQASTSGGASGASGHSLTRKQLRVDC